MPRVAIPDELTAHLEPVDGVEMRFYDPRDRESVPGGGEDIDVLVLPTIAGSWITKMALVPGLRAVILSSAGYEHALAYLPQGVVLANAVGVHDTATAELALMLALAAQRDLVRAVLSQQEGEWARPAPGQGRSLADSRALVLGYGGIGKALARRLLASECQVVAVASQPRDGDDLVDQVHGIEELPDLLPEADLLFISVPLLPATAGLVGAETLRALPDDALVVNVARGGVVDTDALIAECASGRLRAALDVTDPEPLPAGHPLWTTPGVLITPHVGGASPAFLPRMASYVRTQLASYRDTGTLQHVVAPRPPAPAA
ncbi:MAG: NAD(P)-dependent oxidoreductase [Ornithinimicrobium sp.]|uniref:NAD(P)-dependent oxidoreductase n=1 Tax=Ornithinimicrobium sp. TaxID=1977084 RepID=UPI0026DFF0DD|nr:NAD(P)-dependent oxidoreductase [Ornithinimicrobium sp.]MDO5740893.1 NAD(P)-dependent oxidoreductase [Ornithinimicrobium sp.]